MQAAFISGYGESSLDQFVPFVYSELQRLAARYRDGERQAITVQATALVQEVWTLLVQKDQLKWSNRRYYFRVAAGCLRQILVEQARSRLILKRASRGYFDASKGPAVLIGEPELHLLALDDAILALAAIEPRKGRAIELHYFAGLGPEAMADVMEVSTNTAKGDLRIAEAWVSRELTQRLTQR